MKINSRQCAEALFCRFGNSLLVFVALAVAVGDAILRIEDYCGYVCRNDRTKKRAVLNKGFILRSF